MDLSTAHKAHPWHGISLGKDAPDEVTAFIEIVPTDTVKYEVDKESGYLSLDRPQKFSNIVPSLYGFLPQTYCSVKMAELTNKVLARYDVFDPNVNIGDNNSKEYSIGINYYLANRRIRLATNYVYADTPNGNSNRIMFMTQFRP